MGLGEEDEGEMDVAMAWKGAAKGDGPGGALRWAGDDAPPAGLTSWSHADVSRQTPSRCHGQTDQVGLHLSHVVSLELLQQCRLILIGSV